PIAANAAVPSAPASACPSSGSNWTMRKTVPPGGGCRTTGRSTGSPSTRAAGVPVVAHKSVRATPGRLGRCSTRPAGPSIPPPARPPASWPVPTRRIGRISTAAPLCGGSAALPGSVPQAVLVGVLVQLALEFVIDRELGRRQAGAELIRAARPDDG